MKNLVLPIIAVGALAFAGATLEMQRAALAVAKAELADLENQLARSEKLAGQKVISSDELDRRLFATRTANARVVQAEASIKTSETEIERSRVTAPVDGDILKLNVRAGEFAPAGVTPEALLLLGRLDPLHLRVDVDEEDASWRVDPRAKAIAAVRGNPTQQTPLEFVRFEPYVTPKRSLTGASDERVDTRVLQVIYRFKPDGFPIHVGQRMDVFIEAPAATVLASKNLRNTRRVARNDAR
jgi:HlyD family secretion protein